MAEAFVAGADGALVGRMESVEVELVLEMLRQTRSLLGEDEAEPAGEHDLFASLAASFEPREAPQDPAVRRLLPDGGGDDAEASREFRRLTEDTIRQQKQQHLDAAVAAFAQLDEHRSRDGVVTLSRDAARSIMRALTDVRLVLAQRLGIETDSDAEELHDLVAGLEMPSSERELTAMYYDFVTWLAESITIAYMGGA